jgi:hypothetical protein
MNAHKSTGFILSLCAFILIFSCIGERGSDTDNSDSTSATLDTTQRIDNDVFGTLWTYDAEGDSMVKNDIPDDLTVDFVMDVLNKRYENLDITLSRTSADTVFVKLGDVSYLEQLGSTGNYAFMAEVVYCLTEVPNVNLVNFDFPELDHASPGLYRREDFDNKIVE